jgi:hypothetical protein
VRPQRRVLDDPIALSANEGEHRWERRVPGAEREARCSLGALPDARPAAGGHPGIPERRRRRPLGLADELVGEEDEAVTNGLGIDEAHGLLVAGLAEEALAGPEHDWEDDQPQLVDQVMRD